MNSNLSSSCPEPDLVARVQRFNYIRDFWRSKECLAPFPYMDVFQTASESDDCSSVDSARLPPSSPYRPFAAWPQMRREENGVGGGPGGLVKRNHSQISPTAHWLRKHNAESKRKHKAESELSDHPQCTCTTDICTSLEDLHHKMKPVPHRRQKAHQVATSVAAVYEKSSEVTTVIESASCGFHSYGGQGDSMCLKGGGDCDLKEGVSNISSSEFYTATPLPSLSPPPQTHHCQRRLFLILAVLCVSFVAVSALCCYLWSHWALDPHPSARRPSGAPSPFYPSSSLWLNMPDPDRPPQQAAGCDWDCLKLLFN